MTANTSKKATTTKKMKRPRKPKSEEGKPGKYDRRNRLNDLTGKDWLLLTKSWWISESCRLDKQAYGHPAPFMIPDIEKLISLFTKKGMTVLDPFAGSGSALIAANRLGRKAIGIDINEDYRELAEKRLREQELKSYRYYVNDSRKQVALLRSKIDYVVTSPPYHNILRNKGNGIRHLNDKKYRVGARDGVEYYSKHSNDLGNCEDYADFILSFGEIMTKVLYKLSHARYCTIIMSDFTVEKKEICVQSDVVRVMIDVGFEFCGTTVLLQTVKPLFPFGYPYAYKINHHHQNILNFRKPKGG